MIKVKSLVKGVLIAGMSLTLMFLPAMAGNVNYYSDYMENTGQTFNVPSTDGNVKSTAYRDWVVKADYLYYSDTSTPSYGVGHALFTASNRGGIGASSKTIWMKSAGRSTGGWQSGQGYSGVRYYIGIRLDDLLSGYGVSKGAYNSDAY